MPTETHPHDLALFLPDSVLDWHPAEHDREFNKENLYGYINGGAELYLSYGFIGGLHREYFNQSADMISIDIFDMAEAKNAFGVFGHSRETDEQEYGQGSQDYGDAIIFWKGRYYVSISSRGADESLYEAITALAEQVDTAILSAGDLPSVIKILPRDNLLPESLLYFNHSAWQNFYSFIHSENILNIDSRSDAVLAKYQTREGRMSVALISYPSTAEAEEALRSFSAATGIKKLEPLKKNNGKWLLAGLKEHFLVLIPDGSDEIASAQLLQKIIDNLK
jgi:hypothetical protein